MARRTLVLQAVLAITTFVLAGCGSKPLAKIAVKGKVWYRGQPLPGGTIVFAPDAERGNNGPLAKGTIAADGTFALAPETAAGWYRIAVAPLPSDSTSAPTVSNPYPGLPARYRNPNLSGLNGEIKPGTENTFEFNLEDS
jgi:hypothetical protein